MNVTPDCPYGKYVNGMKIECRKTGNRCGHVYFKRCKGWWVNSEQAAKCPLRANNQLERQAENENETGT